jgi:hypothetical protein
MARGKRTLPEETCYGRHVEVARDGHQQIEWDPERSRAVHVRVRDYTCDCEPVFYELCQAGGLRYIRRTSRGGGKVVVTESDPVAASKTDALWLRLMRGEAR